MTSSRKEKESSFSTRLLAEFSKLFGSASPEHPNVSCISRPTLVRELIKIRDRLAYPGSKSIPGQTMLDNLTESGIVHRVPLSDAEGGELIGKFFSIGMDEAPSQLDPIELLQATVPSGIICYFTAIHFHDLSTQIPTHHHIAQLTDIPKASHKQSQLPEHPRARRSTARKRNPLGEQQFFYQDAPYYTTTRDRRLVPGFQTRYLTNRTIFSITDYEQTLLDTLHHPFSCGGQAVVFEAWETALEKIEQSRLLHHLEFIDNQRLSRRVGYILVQHFDCDLDADLRAHLENARNQPISDEATDVSPLLPGYEYNHTNDCWRLGVP